MERLSNQRMVIQLYSFEIHHNSSLLKVEIKGTGNFSGVTVEKAGKRIE